ncbi:putative xyloglucan endotransglucosylase/hydrolase protein 32 [Raphanus sativus]|uniref:Xyloglucan endotransglucosylase/hydrolase n=1 Tax=Raphanus sativus TaxID=3726 RepID=A0A6J0ML15_RAPSA|nr:probable xyloglucan endotransglucosylase/hydrolase protein 32 isoform X1 [Raphanus sativus]KAJ4906988.1 putative xyloglucan endotransglucosylase/hydrolase protein 32 [Raphanus sativus]
MGSYLISLLPVVLMLVLLGSSVDAYWPPSPGYWPSSKVGPVSFYKGFRNLWGPQHQRMDQNALNLWLDRASGSGFKSVKPFRSGYFGASIKLQPGYTAGVITSLYLSNNEAHPGFHDEVDIEFLGTTFGKPYTLQTNVYISGSGDGKIIGREMKYRLWFDPTSGFHHYAILWNPKEIIFLVDDIPIRRYPKKSAATFPLRPMWLYGSIWDASSWATEDGKYKADYKYQPFTAKYTNFKAIGCTAYSSAWCHPVSASPYRSGGLTRKQYQAMRWVQTHSMVYDYCKDYKRDHSLTPECWR